MPWLAVQVYAISPPPLAYWSALYRRQILVESVHSAATAFNQLLLCDPVVHLGVAFRIESLYLLRPILPVAVLYFEEAPRADYDQIRDLNHRILAGVHWVTKFNHPLDLVDCRTLVPSVMGDTLYVIMVLVLPVYDEHPTGTLPELVTNMIVDVGDEIVESA